MMNQIVGIVGEHKPDVLLVCGDVYHTSQPSAAVQTMFTESLMSIHAAHPGMTIVVTAGNHDSGTKHEIFRTPWRSLKVHTIGRLDKDNPDEHIIEVPEKGFIVAVPYCNERNMPEGFFQTLLDKVEESNTGRLPVVMTAHTTVSGCDITGHRHDSEYVAGDIDSIEVEQFGHGYDYLALGHIHHAQFVHTGNHNVRYSGTPLAISFDENYQHSVSMVEISGHGDKPIVEIIEIANPRPLVTLPTEGVADWATAKGLLTNFPDDIPAYIRLNVETDNFLPVEANAQAVSLTEGKQCRFCLINARRKAAGKSADKTLTVQEFKAMEPMEIALRYADASGILFDDGMTRLFREVIKMVDDETRETL